MKTRNFFAMVVAAAATIVFVTLGNGAFAQSAERSEMVIAQTQQRQTAKITPLPAELQAILKRGDRQGALDMSRKLGVSPGGGVQPYTCSEGSCACAGVSDCVNMIAGDAKCAAGSVACNPNGCTCKEA